MYLFQRLVQGLLVLLGVTTIVFALTFVAGDPASTLAPLDTTPAELAQFRHNMGLDQPIPVQYAGFLGRALHGDFGVSFRHRTSALPLVLERLPVTALHVVLEVVAPLRGGHPLPRYRRGEGRMRGGDENRLLESGH